MSSRVLRSAVSLKTMKNGVTTSSITRSSGVSRSASSIAGVPEATRTTVLNLSKNLTNSLDLENFVLTYGAPNSQIPDTIRPLAVVKVGGEVITKDIENLTNSVKFLKNFGLLPVIVHGGGPQLNDELAKLGVEPIYIGGHRVTDAETMKIAKRVFESANAELTAALNKAGVPARGIVGGIFGAEIKKPELGFVGEINKVVSQSVNDVIEAGEVPVLTSLGFNSAGETLNINADVAARELSINLKPMKVVFISSGGGWKENGEVISDLNLARDYKEMSSRDYTGRQGTLLKLNEMKQIIDNLPASASVTITSAAHLASQLLPHKGPGTQIRKGKAINFYPTVGSSDFSRLETLFKAYDTPEAPFSQYFTPEINGYPGENHVLSKYGKVVAVLSTEDHGAAAIFTSPKDSTAPYLAQLVLTPQALSEGLEEALWESIKKNLPSFFWAAKPANNITDGVKILQSEGPTASAVAKAFSPLSVSRTGVRADSVISVAPLFVNSVVPVDSFCSVGIAPAELASNIAALTPLFSSSTTSSSSVAASTSSNYNVKQVKENIIRIGLLGARGYVAREILKLFAGHSRFQVVVASSRALVGKPVLEGMGIPDFPGSVTPDLLFSDLSPEALEKAQHPDVDVWVLALPNGLADAHVRAIEKACASKNIKTPLMIDLSADYRFDDSGEWVYGLPEIPGQQELLQKARKISNPGCYATATQLALLPFAKNANGIAGIYGAAIGNASTPATLKWNKDKPLTAFGVSGYSGAGTTPSDKNDPEKLRDNLIPYALVNHIHEREVSRYLGNQVAFMPHVAPFFQGISMTTTGYLDLDTVDKEIRDSLNADYIRSVYEKFYGSVKQVSVAGAKETVTVRTHGTNKHGVTLGNFTYDPKTGRVVVVSAIDNLLKGAATQAVQNLNIASGIDEFEGIPLK